MSATEGLDPAAVQHAVVRTLVVSQAIGALGISIGLPKEPLTV